MTDGRMKARMGWDAYCETCGSSLVDEEYQEPDFTEFDEDYAISWAAEHRCERKTVVSPPALGETGKP